MPLRKLTTKQTEQIRRAISNGMSIAAVVRCYGISSTHAYRIKNNTQRNRRKSNTMEKYNGWTNHATWLFYLHHQEDIENWHHEQRRLNNKDNCHNAQQLKKIFEDMYGELIDGIANLYLTDVILAELRDVNWDEIYKTISEE